MFAGDGSWGYGGRSVEKEKEKEKEKIMLFVLTFGVCVEIGRKNSILGERGEKRSHARDNCPSYPGRGLHQKVKKLSTEKRYTVLRY